MGFIYVSVNAVTQACMSFTSQNYGVGNYKRMDKVLRNCMVLSVAVAAVMGSCFWFFGPQILRVYTNNPEVITHAMEIMSITVMPYFLCGIMDLFPGSTSRNGTFRSADDPVCHRNRRNQNYLDLWCVSTSQDTAFPVCLLSGILGSYNCSAGCMFLVCKEESTSDVK